MEGPRKPRDIHNYLSVQKAAEWLRGYADTLEKAKDGALIKCHITTRFWYPEWERKPKAKTLAPPPQGTRTTR